MRVAKLAPAIGAEVLGMDLSQPMDDALFREIERAWHAHCILLFRKQTLDDLQQVAFAARFGELAHTLKAYEGGKLHPALMYVTNEKRDGKYVGALPDGEMFFHSDMCYLEPDLDSLIHCMETLLENRAKDLDWSQAAAWIGETFSWASIVRRLAPHF